MCIQPLFTDFAIVKANLKTPPVFTLTELSTRKPLNEIFTKDTVARQRHQDKGQTVYRLLCRRPILHAESWEEQRKIFGKQELSPGVSRRVKVSAAKRTDPIRYHHICFSPNPYKYSKMAASISHPACKRL